MEIFGYLIYYFVTVLKYKQNTIFKLYTIQYLYNYKCDVIISNVYYLNYCSLFLTKHNNKDMM